MDPSLEKIALQNALRECQAELEGAEKDIVDAKRRLLETIVSSDEFARLTTDDGYVRLLLASGTPTQQRSALLAYEVCFPRISIDTEIFLCLIERQCEDAIRMQALIQLLRMNYQIRVPQLAAVLKKLVKREPAGSDFGNVVSQALAQVEELG